MSAALIPSDCWAHAKVAQGSSRAASSLIDDVAAITHKGLDLRIGASLRIVAC